MAISRMTVIGLLCLSATLLAAAARAEDAPAAAPVSAGRDLVLAKCFQCHTDAMFRDARQDRRAWEATVYRMIGYGALWKADEVAAMADYLGESLGRSASPPGSR